VLARSRGAAVAAPPNQALQLTEDPSYSECPGCRAGPLQLNLVSGRWAGSRGGGRDRSANAVWFILGSAQGGEPPYDLTGTLPLGCEVHTSSSSA
jgi:hypothetical protein